MLLIDVEVVADIGQATEVGSASLRERFFDWQVEEILGWQIWKRPEQLSRCAWGRLPSQGRASSRIPRWQGGRANTFRHGPRSTIGRRRSWGVGGWSAL